MARVPSLKFVVIMLFSLVLVGLMTPESPDSWLAANADMPMLSK
jgi:hypothetical protein